MATKLKNLYQDWADRFLGLIGRCLKKLSPWFYLQLKRQLLAWESSRRQPRVLAKLPYKVRPYQAGDETGLIRLLNSFFVGTDYRRWVWKYRDSPLGSSILVAENEDKKIVGQFAVLPQLINYYSQSGLAHQIVEIGIEADYQGQGFLEQGFNYFIKQADFLPWGFVGEKLVLAYAKAIPGAGASRANQTINLNAREKKLGWFYQLRKHLEPQQPELDDIKIEPLAGRGEELDQLWARKKGEIKVGLVRDWKFIRWRIIERAMPSDLFLIKKRAETIGYFALRPKGTTAIISDILIINQYVDQTTIASLENFCHQLGFKKIKLVSTDPTLLAILSQRGYAKGKELYFTYNDFRRRVEPKDIYLTAIDADWELEI